MGEGAGVQFTLAGGMRHGGSGGMAADAPRSRRRRTDNEVPVGCTADERATECAAQDRVSAGSVRRSAWPHRARPGATASWRMFVTLGVIAAVHLQSACGQPRYVEYDQKVQYLSPTGVLLLGSGTPPENHLFELKCKVDGDAPNCAIPSNPRFTWGPGMDCTQGSVCFLVATIGATDVVFSTSPLLSAHIDARTVKATVTTLPVKEDAPHRVRKYEIADVRGFPEFRERRDLEVCFDTVPAGAGKRCVQFYFGVPPFQLRVSVDGGPFLSKATSRTMPYQKSRVVVRVLDVNVEDRVCIDNPSIAGMSSVAGLPGRVERQDTAWFEWEDVGECFDATRCVAGLVGSVCAGGEWERIFTLKAKTQNATVVFGGSQNLTTIVRSSSRMSSFSDSSAEIASVSLHVILGVPAFLDQVPLPVDARVPGTPYSHERLATAFINCPIPSVAVYSVLQAWRNSSGANGVLYYNYKSSEPVEIVPHGQLPGGMVLTGSEMTTNVDQTNSGGNYYLQGRMSILKIDWTPSRGQEGHDHEMCFMARGKESKASNIRCFVVPVARCQYCTIAGDSLSSLAIDYKTSWLQLWAANSGPLFDSDNEANYPLNPAHLPPGTRLSLGPVYHVKAHDSLDSLATRFHTHVDRIMDMNPDLATEHVEIGQELCIMPNVCPKLPNTPAEQL